MDHFKILKRAWEIVWKYRALLVIGLVLVLAGGAVGGFNLPTGGSSGGGRSSGGGSGGGGQLPSWNVVWEKIAPFVIVAVIVLAILLLFGTLLAIVKLVLRYITRAALIKMVDRYEEREEQIGFMEGIRLGWRGPTARRLFLIRLILALPILLLGLIIMVAGIAVVGVITLFVVNAVKSGTDGASTAAVVVSIIAALFFFVIVLMPLIIIGTLLRMVLMVIQEISFRVCALQDMAAWDSIRSAVALIRRNLWPTVLQALLMIGLGIAWNVLLMVVNVPLMLLALFIAGLPSLFIGGLVALTISPVGAIVIGLFILVLVAIILIGLPNLALATFATVYYSTVWTLTYRELRAIDAGEDRETELIEVKTDPE